MAYRYLKDWSRRTVPDKVLRNKACDIVIFASMVYKFFDKKTISLAQSET